jgi:hypothetical protein
MMPSPTEFHASIADVTDEHHQNMAGLVQPDDFNAEVVVRFLRDNGVNARVDESPAAFATRSPIQSTSHTCASRASVCVHRSATRPKPRSGVSRRSDDHQAFAPAPASSDPVERTTAARAG